MAVVLASPAKQPKVVDKSDITRNLPSLQFESALANEESKYLALRARSHALAVSTCAQATYFASVLNQAREINAEMRNPGHRQTAKFLLEGQGQDPLQVGLLGCGRLGSQLVNCLLTYGEIRPRDIKISTRRPETLVDLREKGVHCCYDNPMVASTSHIIFLCVLPAQVNAVVADIRHELPREATVYSLVNSVPVTRLQLLLRHDNIIKPEFRWRSSPSLPPWDCSKDMLTCFEDQFMIRTTCPLTEMQDESVVWTDASWIADVIYAFTNMCGRLGLTRQETLDVLHAAIFGDGPPVTLTSLLTEDSLLRGTGLDLQPGGTFPRFDLVKLHHEGNPLLDTLTSSEALRNSFIKEYCYLFERFTQWKNKSV